MVYMFVVYTVYVCAHWPTSSTQQESFADPIVLLLLQWALVCELPVGKMLNRTQKRVKFLA